MYLEGPIYPIPQGSYQHNYIGQIDLKQMFEVRSFSDATEIKIHMNVGPNCILLLSFY